MSNKPHKSNKDCWCHPVFVYKDEQTGNEVWTHSEWQSVSKKPKPKPPYGK